MKILGVGGSPHKNGFSERLLNNALNGAEESGAEVNEVYLTDLEIKHCIGCDYPCWDEMVCSLDDDGLELRRKLSNHDALIFSVPVYFLSVNGLSKNFMDRMRYYGDNGKPALSVLVAGGTGKGCVMTAQEVTRWLIMLGYRPLIPVLATRYNLDIAAAEARMKGKEIVETDRSPFSSLSEQIAEYESLPYMNWTMLDEMGFLTEHCIREISKLGHPEMASKFREKLERGRTLLESGNEDEGLDLIVSAQEESLETFEDLQEA